MTIRDLLLERAEKDTPALLTHDRSWTWRELVADASSRAAAIADLLDPDRPPHVGLLMDNTPEMILGLSAAGLGHHVAVGVNSTRRGDALLADLRRADVQVLLTDATQRHLLEGLDLTGIEVIDTDEWNVAPRPAPARPTLGPVLAGRYPPYAAGRSDIVRTTGGVLQQHRLDGPDPEGRIAADRPARCVGLAGPGVWANSYRSLFALGTVEPVLLPQPMPLMAVFGISPRFITML